MFKITISLAVLLWSLMLLQIQGKHVGTCGWSNFFDVATKITGTYYNLHFFYRSLPLNGSLSKSSQPVGVRVDTDREGVHKEEAKDNARSLKENANQENMALIVTDDDVAGPETPGMQPLSSQVKRSRDAGSKFGSLLNSGKRVRFLDDSMALDTTKKEVEMASKFEWLDPSRIRDANGRRPNNPLYDRTTLYIPPEVLSKLSASQKQYWSVKCKYMDVVLFFKVVSLSSSLNIGFLIPLDPVVYLVFYA